MHVLAHVVCLAQHVHALSLFTCAHASRLVQQYVQRGKKTISDKKGERRKETKERRKGKGERRKEKVHAHCISWGHCHLDDLLLGAWQLDVAPIKALTLSGCTPQAVSLPRASLLMHRNHAGPHKKDAHVHVGTCICSSRGRSCSIM